MISFFFSGKSYTMLGSPESANTLGIIPCAISWLFRSINEQKQKTGARFSVRVSAVEVCGPSNQLKDLLAGYSNGNYFLIFLCFLFCTITILAITLTEASILKYSKQGCSSSIKYKLHFFRRTNNPITQFCQ